MADAPKSRWRWALALAILAAGMVARGVSGEAKRYRAAAA